MSLKVINYKPKLNYYEEEVKYILYKINNGYKLVIGDPGIRNLIMLRDEDISLGYTIKQYNSDCDFHEIEADIINKHEKSSMDELEADIREINYRYKQEQSFNLLLDKIKKMFGSKIILCVGDSGYNKINKDLIEFLSKHLIIYLVSEYGSSKKCSRCNNRVQFIKRNKKVILSEVECKNCKIILNRDGNACSNMMSTIVNTIETVRMVM